MLFVMILSMIHHIQADKIQNAQIFKECKMANLFIIEVDYTASLEVIDSIVGEHRAYLAKGYEQGFLLASGPRNPKTGGIIIGRFPSLESVQEFTKNDPYNLKNAATYNIIEFSPVLHNEAINGFCGK